MTDSCRPHFENLKILTVPGILAYELSVYIHRSKLNLPQLGQNHNHNTRNRNQIALPQHSTSFFEKSPFYIGTKIYNKLPEEISGLKNLKMFKKK